MRYALVLLAAISLGMLGPGGSARAQNGAPPDDMPKVQIGFIPEQRAVKPGGTVTVALKEIIRKGWHTYWINPGDSGAPTEIKWKLPEGWKAGPIQWPAPSRLPVGPLMNFGYSDQALLLVDVTAPASAKPGQVVTLPADLDWLVCSDVCVPEEGHLDLSLGIENAPPPPDDATKALFAQARALLPKSVSWPARFAAGDKRFALYVPRPELAVAKSVEFYPYTDGLVEPAAKLAARTLVGGLLLESTPGWRLAKPEERAKVKELSGVLVLAAAGGEREAFALTAVPGAVPAAPPAALGLAQAVFFAFLGGIILNLMPCVLPVLSMKALAVAKHGQKAAKREALSYGAGVVVAFLSLAAVLLLLRAGGTAVGWGFQLQQPAFVAALALLMFAVGLNLSGLYEITAGGLADVGGRTIAKGGLFGSFLTGLLAVVVAAPCTAPFMAAALGVALTETAGFALAVFLALALGFAAPFVLLGFSPALLRVLPHPGPWMTRFRQALAFPMYGAAIWLVWVLSQQVGPDGLFAVLAAGLALAFALWAFGISRGKQGRTRAAGMSAAVLGLVLTFAFVARVANDKTPPQANPQVAGAIRYEPYSAQRFAALKAAGRPVFVNATAAWCITCLVNERVALSSATLAKAFADNGVAALKADWTNQNPEITALLTENGRTGVPLYLYVPKGKDAIILPQILTEATMLNAIAPKHANAD